MKPAAAAAYERCSTRWMLILLPEPGTTILSTQAGHLLKQNRSTYTIYQSIAHQQHFELTFNQGKSPFVVAPTPDSQVRTPQTSSALNVFEAH